MKYQAIDRLKIAWRWLPLEVLIVFICTAAGWGASVLISKPVYQTRMDVEIKYQLPKSASKRRVKRQREKDIKNVAQFSVMPHQSGVLYQANDYAYTHYGVWQSVRSLSEAVRADPVDKKPALRIVVSSSSEQLSVNNAQAFRHAMESALSVLTRYDVHVTRPHTDRVDNVLLGTFLKFSVVVGVGLAGTFPYFIYYIRRKDRDNHG